MDAEIEKAVGAILRSRPPGGLEQIRACNTIADMMAAQSGDAWSKLLSLAGRPARGPAKYSLNAAGEALCRQLHTKGVYMKLLDILGGARPTLCTAALALLGRIWDAGTGPGSTCAHEREHLALLACMQKHRDDHAVVTGGLGAMSAQCEWRDCASTYARQGAGAIIAALMERHAANKLLLTTACNNLAAMAQCRQLPFCGWGPVTDVLHRFRTAADGQLLEWASAAMVEAVRHKALLRAAEAPWPARACALMVQVVRSTWKRGVDGARSAAAASAGASASGGAGGSRGIMDFLGGGPPRTFNYKVMYPACHAVVALAAHPERVADLVAAGAVEVMQTVYRGTAGFGFEVIMPDATSGPAHTASACLHALALLRVAGVEGALPAEPFCSGLGGSDTSESDAAAADLQAVRRTFGETSALFSLDNPFAVAIEERGTLIELLYTEPAARADAAFVESACLAIRNIAAADVPGRAGRDRTVHAAAAGGAGEASTAAGSSAASKSLAERETGLGGVGKHAAEHTSRVITGVLQYHIGNPRVVAAACGALRNLCAGHKGDEASCFLETVFAAASLHAHGEEDVAFESCAALYAVLHRSRDMVMKILGEQLHAGSAAAAAMACHQSSARIAWVGCGVLCKLAEFAASDFDFREEVLDSLLDDDAVHVPLVRALRTHTGDPRVVRAASTALRLLVSADSRSRAAALGEGRMDREEIATGASGAHAEHALSGVGSREREAAAWACGALAKALRP